MSMQRSGGDAPSHTLKRHDLNIYLLPGLAATRASVLIITLLMIASGLPFFSVPFTKVEFTEAVEHVHVNGTW
jgi:hypothetical protein